MTRVTLPESLAASGRYEEFAKGPGARHGRSNSLKWPWLYDKLRAKGYDKSKAAAISNSRIHMRKKGRISVLPAKAAHNPEVLKRLGDSKGHVTKGKLTKGVKGLSATAEFLETVNFACTSRACAPPPVGSGGSNGKGGSGKALGRPLKSLRDPDGGMTVSTGSFKSIETGFAVAIDGSDKLIVAKDAFDKSGEPSKALVDLVRDRIDSLDTFDAPAGTKKALGGWHNPEDGKIEVNTTVVFPKNQRAAAEAFARSQNQISMANLDAIKAGNWDDAIINTGGTGGDRNV